MLPDIAPFTADHEACVLDICIGERILLTSADTAGDFRGPVFVFFVFFLVFVRGGTCERLFLSRRRGLVVRLQRVAAFSGRWRRVV
jgi:hypothetical protein